MVGTPIEFGTVLDLCRHEHRRIVLAVVAEQKRSLTVNDLVKTVVKYNHHTSLTDVSEETTTAIQTALHHAHLPRLAEAGLVEYDRERGLVEPTAEFDRAEPHLSAILEADPKLETPVDL